MKTYHDQTIKNQEFAICVLILLLNSRLCLFLGKLNSKWIGSILITKMFPHRIFELENNEDTWFKVNGQRIRSVLGMRNVFMKLLKPAILMNSKQSRGLGRSAI